MTGYLSRLAALEPTVVLDPVPEVCWAPTRLNLLALVTDVPVSDWVTTSAAHYQTRNAAALELLGGVQSPRLRRSQPQAMLCNSLVPDRCVVQAPRELF